MTLELAHVTIDCTNAATLARFWADLLDVSVDPDANEYFATVGRSAGMHPILMFIQVDERTPGKNSVHLDFSAMDWKEQIERAVSLGAEHVGDYDEFGTQWTTLRDPEGNLFDVALRAGV